MKNMLDRWPKLVLIGLPLCILIVDAAVLVGEHRQSDASKAVRLVQESTSRKENFTVQQFLYATVYHRRRNGGAVDIRGWSCERVSTQQTVFAVEFRFSDANGTHAARWSANPYTGNVLPLNDLASDLSWH